MKVKIKIKEEVVIRTLVVEAGVRYWEDATVNDIEDKAGDLIPCRDGDYWKPIIDIETGVITNWTKGVVADIHYKVCDDGTYYLKDAKNKTILKKEGYVPKILDLYNDSFGDYIILKVDTEGKISDWNNNPNVKDFKNK